jgi:hypothetical protein
MESRKAQNLWQIVRITNSTAAGEARVTLRRPDTPIVGSHMTG